jgi:glycosyltransferase involved in cell wall biosynthesis
MPNDPTQPLVDIAIVSYNHGPYLRRAIEGVLSQKTNFPFRVILSDDVSTDAETSEIISEYRARNLPNFTILNHEKNLGGFQNVRQTFEKLTAKYLVHLEGDDYWTDPKKLQIQIDILEDDPTLSACAHNVVLRREPAGTETLLHPAELKDRRYTIEDYIAGRTYQHISSLVYRNVFGSKVPDAYWDPLAGEWFLTVLFLQYGDLYYIADPKSVYRQHPAGEWSSLNENSRRRLNLRGRIRFNELLDGKYSKLFHANDFHEAKNLSRLSDFDRFARLKYFFLAVSVRPTAGSGRTLLHLFFRPIARFLYRTMDLIKEYP